MGVRSACDLSLDCADDITAVSSTKLRRMRCSRTLLIYFSIAPPSSISALSFLSIILTICPMYVRMGYHIHELTGSQLRVWRLVVLAILILLVRRLPSIIACYKFVPDIKTFREALFTGWFGEFLIASIGWVMSDERLGPMGVGAVFISTLARSSLPEGEPEQNTEAVDRLKDVIMPVTLFLVLSSIVTRKSIPSHSLLTQCRRHVNSIFLSWSPGPFHYLYSITKSFHGHARR